MWPRKFLYCLAALSLTTLVMGAGGSSGCDTQQMPTVQQIELNLPDSIRHCPYAPKSPGYNATQRQTGKYLVGLYAAWEQCHGNLATADALYLKWKAQVRKTNK